MLVHDANPKRLSDPTQLDLGSRLMLFDLLIGGHHAGYILHLIKYWCDWKLDGNLDIVVSSRFHNHHPDVIDAASNAPGNIHFVAITAEEESSLNSQKSVTGRATRSFQEWHLLRKYIEALQPTRCLIMYFDTCQYPLALGKSLSCPFASIYFRPTFHYSEFEGHTSTWKGWMQRWRELLFLNRILASPQLKTLFCLDPFVVKHLNRRGNVEAIYLPDPVQAYNQPDSEIDNLKKRLAIEANRRVFLLFGALEDRKGIYKVLEATAMLPPPLCEKLCLLFAGPVRETDEVIMQSRVNEITRSLPVQILVDNRFVSDQEVQLYFQLADVVLAPYQHHVGMSAILVRAATAQKPVLSQNYGLMGEVTRRYGLGLTVDSTQSEEIMKGMAQLLVKSSETLNDRAQMQLFAQQNNAREFARIIFQNLHS